MIFGSPFACIGLFYLPIVRAFSDAQSQVLILNSNTQKLFNPICHLDERPSNLNAALQQDNITHTALPSHNPKLAITSLPTWVDPPFCISQPKPTPDSPPYCIWTSRDFRSGRGISIIATQEAANTLASSRWFLNAHVQIPNTVPTPGYKVTPLPGRGLGLIANRTYKRGDLIMSEIPLLLSSLSLEKSSISEAEQARLYRNAVSRLPIKSRKIIEGLHGYPDQSAARKFAANAFNVFDFAGLFPAVARMNHDCRPNAAFHFDKDTFAQRISAIRPIGKGEEITISYLSHYLPSNERARRTHSHWGFTCTCALCSSPSAILDSDTRLQRIRKLEVLIYQAHSKPTPGLANNDSTQGIDPEVDEYSDEKADSTELAEELLLLYQEEGLDGALVRAYDNLVLAWGRKDDVGRAKVREYARLGVEEAELWPGKGSVEMKRFLKLLE